MPAPVDAIRCPICLQLECDTHSLQQQMDALRGCNIAVTKGSVTSVGKITGCSLGPLLPEGERGPFTLGFDPASPGGDHAMGIALRSGMEGRMEVVAEVKMKPRLRGKLTLRG